MQQQRKKSNWLLFLSLYTTQYVGMGFMMVALIGILRQKGVDLADLSIVYVIGVPWIFKFAWAPLVDRFHLGRKGHYRSWLLVLQLLMVLLLLCLSCLSLDNQFDWIIVVGFVFVVCSATQDIATDALASREFERHERGILNGIQLSGGLLGNVIGGGGVLILYPYIGWKGAFYLMAAVTFVSWVQLLFFLESDKAPIEKQLSVKQTVQHFFSFWKGKLLWFWVLFTGVMGFSLIYGILAPMMMDGGKSLPEVGMALNVFGMLVGVLSGLLAGGIIQRVGRKRALRWFATFQVIGFIAMLPVAFVMNHFTLYFSLTMYFMIYPSVSAIMYTLMMDYAAQNTMPGTDYALQFTVITAVGMPMASLSLQIAHHFGYAGVIMAAVLIALVALLLAVIYAKKLPPETFVERYVR